MNVPGCSRNTEEANKRGKGKSQGRLEGGTRLYRGLVADKVNNGGSERVQDQR